MMNLHKKKFKNATSKILKILVIMKLKLNNLKIFFKFEKIIWLFGCNYHTPTLYSLYFFYFKQLTSSFLFEFIIFNPPPPPTTYKEGYNKHLSAQYNAVLGAGLANFKDRLGVMALGKEN